MNSSKRKRQAGHVPLSQAHHPPDSINPFSRAPAQLLQFSVAGLNEREPNPADAIADFPHRGFDTGVPRRSSLEHGLSEEEKKKQRKEPGDKPKKQTPQGRQLEILTQSIHLFLDNGDVARAARAFGLILQLRPNGFPVDVRHHNLWALGVEILMRGGEEPAEQSTDQPPSSSHGPASAGSRRRRRWGTAANMATVKAYFEMLIQRYPYDHRHPHKLSSLDFQLSMLSCEIYNVCAEYDLVIRNVDDLGTQDSLRHAGEDQSDVDSTGASLHEKHKDDSRAQALGEMRIIASRMDQIGRDPPFSKSQDFYKLRATASLYIADLIVPYDGKSESATEQGDLARTKEHEIAKVALGRVMDLGGTLDRSSAAFLGLD